MLEILKYILSDFFIFIGSFALLYMVLYFGINGISNILNRFIRMINIALRGWPPNHLDADGDLKDLHNTNK